MADYWMKLYIEILDDPKMATLPDRVWRRVIELFLVAKRLGKEGHLPDTRQIAWMLRMSPDELEADMAQIVHTGIIEREVGGWFIPKFAKRQGAVSDAERQAQGRKRKQSNEYYGDVTDESRNVTQRTEDRLTDNRLTETDTETEQSASSPFDIILKTLESKTGLPPTGKSSIDAINAMIANQCEPVDVIAGCDWMKKEGRVIKQYSSVVGPANTARLKRVQGTKNGNGNGYRKQVDKLVDADGNTTIVYSDGTQEFTPCQK